MLAFVIERAFSLIFGHRKSIDDSNVKEFIAFATSLGVVAYWKFDLISIQTRMQQGGYPKDGAGYVVSRRMTRLLTTTAVPSGAGRMMTAIAKTHATKY